MPTRHRGTLAKKLCHRIATQPLSQNGLAMCVDTVNLKDIFGQVQTYPNYLHDILLHCS